jgi:hypothetical protein
LRTNHERGPPAVKGSRGPLRHRLPGLTALVVQALLSKSAPIRSGIDPPTRQPDNAAESTHSNRYAAVAFRLSRRRHVKKFSHRIGRCVDFSR